MKSVVLSVVLFVSVHASVNAQELFFTRNGHVDFFSSTPMEDIKAENDKVTSIINVTTGEIEFSMLINAFQFEKALMQEHFNENYMESTKYPKSFFKGKINNIDKVDFKKDGTYPVKVSGDLTIHGVTKPVSTDGTIIVKDGKFTAQSSFLVNPEDYKIEIPNLVRDKIARELKVNVEGTYEPFKK